MLRNWQRDRDLECYGYTAASYPSSNHRDYGRYCWLGYRDC
ncbi:MAG: hypothetical protein RI580_07440 [Halothece sp. Uz-M2-17]|nr:hypothetical protein [Halothece sp. Uz-M2-17]